MSKRERRETRQHLNDVIEEAEDFSKGISKKKAKQYSQNLSVQRKDPSYVKHQPKVLTQICKDLLASKRMKALEKRYLANMQKEVEDGHELYVRNYRCS